MGGKPRMIKVPLADCIIAFAQSKGSDANDIRDAAHEVCHALEGNANRWDRESVHRALQRKFTLGPADMLAAEIRARAVERIVCERLNVDYDTDQWLHIAALETIQNGIVVPEGFFREAVDHAVSSKRVQALADQVMALGE